MIRSDISGEVLDNPIYVSSNSKSITSLMEFVNTKTEVYYCKKSGHLQTKALPDLMRYYDEEYEILISSEEEDQLYKIVDGENVYRFEFQCDTFLSKVSVPLGAKILDYGCAKSTTIKKLCKKRPDIIPYLFDVSCMYIDYWGAFVKKKNWSTHNIKPEWNNTFNVVTSFFALEHVADPRQMLNQIRSLLIDNGLLYIVVPNVYTNIADFVVADHINHFSEVSLKCLLSITGFDVLEIDKITHESAFVVICRKSQSVGKYIPAQNELDSIERVAIEISNYWQNISKKIHQFESSLGRGDRYVIYGSGFYGTFIASCLENIDGLACFLDCNPHRLGKEILGKPIVSIANIPEDIAAMYVGLNPKIAREVMSNITEFEINKLNICYL